MADLVDRARAAVTDRAELPGMEVVAETGDGQEALRLIGEKKPDLALIDISMPGLNGLDVAARAGKEFPATRIVILSMHVDDEFVRAVKRPRHGRINVVVFAELAREFAVDAQTIWDALFPARGPARRDYRR